MIVRKVWRNKATNQLLITIPLEEGIKEEDYIEIHKVKYPISVICDYCGKQFIKRKDKIVNKNFCNNKCRDSYFSTPSKFSNNSQYTNEFIFSLRDKIKQRDNYTCQLCGLRIENEKRRSSGLIAHHINRNKKNDSPFNLITLCRKCHTLPNHTDKLTKVILIKKAKENCKKTNFS